LLMLLAVSVATTGLFGPDCAAQDAGTASPSPGLPSTIAADADGAHAVGTPGAPGFKASSNAYGRLDLPFDIAPRSNVKDRIKPAGDTRDWSLGMSFNLNSPRTGDFGPNSGLGLQFKPAPGFVLEGKF